MNRKLIGATMIALAMTQVALSSDYSKVNGSISIAAGETVGRAATVNGSIQVGERARVGAARTVNGKLHLGAGAVGAGTLTFERTVELFVSETAKIGPVTGSTAVRFKGATPPG